MACICRIKSLTITRSTPLPSALAGQSKAALLPAAGVGVKGENTLNVSGHKAKALYLIFSLTLVSSLGPIVVYVISIYALASYYGEGAIFLTIFLVGPIASLIVLVPVSVIIWNKAYDFAAQDDEIPMYIDALLRSAWLWEILLAIGTFRFCMSRLGS